MYLIRHDASGSIDARSFESSGDAYDRAIQHVMSSGEQHSVIWATIGQESCLGLVDGEVMLTISGGNAEKTTIPERSYIRAAMSLNEYEV